ncbi:MAG: SpoIIE family protein phosphatase [Chitinophagales bacterium]
MTNTILSQTMSSSAKELERKLLLKQLQIESLLEITTAINNNFPAEVLFRIYEFILRAQMRVSKLIVLHKNDTWNYVCYYGVNNKTISQIDIEKQLLIYDKTTYLKDLDDKFLSSFELLIPVYHKEEPLAFILIGDIEYQPHLSKEEKEAALGEKRKFIQTISNIIIVAIENKRLFKRQIEQEGFKKELEVASKVQNMLIPSVLPNNEQIEMHAFYMPHHSIGGDYYDYIPINKNEFVICMADVSGKGIAAALLMANVQAVLRTLSRQTSNLKELVLELNQRVMEITNGDKFITLFLAKYHLKTRNLTYINAGHNPPIMFANDKIQLLESGTTILGAIEKLPFVNEGSVILPKNTVMMTYTDGLTDLESEKGEYFEMERLQDFVTKYAHLNMTDFNEELLQSIKSFKGEQAYTDDVSVLSCRIF